MSTPEVRGLAHAADTTTDDDVRRLFELSTDLLATAGSDGCFLSLNPAWERVLGWSREELTSRPFLDFVHEEDRDRMRELAEQLLEPGAEVPDFENRYRHKDGGWVWLLWSARSDGERWYGVAKDVTERKALERRAVLDPLTGLPNRLVLMDRLTQALLRRRRTGSALALLFIDLDRFKVANDTLGHDVGDRVLVAAARRLQETLRETDTVARLGGDEFVILVEDLASDEHALELAQRVVLAFEQPFDVVEDGVTVRASVGVTISAPGERESPEVLLREADTAMYRAKADGRDRYELFDDEMRAEVASRVRVASELRHALGRDELRLVYQPLVALGDGAAVGAEALIRWQHPDRGLLAPATFLPLAEENGLIVPIGDWVLREACRQAATWRREGRQITVSVNVSPTQLAQPGFVTTVRDATKQAGLPAHCLSLEVVEASVVANPERVAQTLAGLRALGARVALDDFGKGATSLSYFRSLPLDVVKLDRSFVVGLRSGSEDRAIVAAVVSLAEEMGLSVVAEGIESEAQLSDVRQLGCDYAQGFFFARPETADLLRLEGFDATARPGLGDPFVIREFMRQIGIPARIQ